ncbi:MAG: hypothetical protein ACK40O_02780 [Allosphingosinicella sp.]
MKRKNILLATFGAGAAAIGGFFGARMWRSRKGEGPNAAIAGDGEPGAVGTSGSARQAGPESMRDPPSEWTHVDEASDESFPASDPPAVNPHVD